MTITRIKKGINDKWRKKAKKLNLIGERLELGAIRSWSEYMLNKSESYCIRNSNCLYDRLIMWEMDKGSKVMFKAPCKDK